MKKGIFITIEGPDGCGKSTQAERLCRYLKAGGRKVLHTREPGGTVVAEALRKILLNPENRVPPLAELFLYEASRVQHLEELILPALREGRIVVSERFCDATIAYQGYGRRLDGAMIRGLNRIASGGLVPDLTVLLDIDAEDGLRKARRKKADRIEKEDVGFHKRVRRGYLDIAKNEPRRVKVIKVRTEIEDTQREIRKVVDRFLKKD